MSRAAQLARRIHAAALAAVEPRRVVAEHVVRDGEHLVIDGRRYDLTAFADIAVVAIGKAALPTADALAELLPTAEGLVVTNQDGVAPPGFELLRGDHPVPGAGSLAAGRRVLDFVRRMDRDDAWILFAISGGASALCELALDASIDGDDLRETNRVLVGCGARIEEINTVRRRLSAIKGGRLAAAAPRAVQVSLLISDVNPGDLVSLGSGPTIVEPRTEDVDAVLDRHGLRDALPSRVLEVLARPTTAVVAPDRAQHVLLCDNRTAVTAAAECARSLGLRVEVDDAGPEEDVATVADRLVTAVTRGDDAYALVSGGEAVCPVRGDGVGGRNLETALRASIALDGHTGDIAVLSAGTDGIDGNSPANGAVADPTTAARASAAGLDVRERLAASDSFAVFDALGDALVSGPTGTNVRDVRVAVRTG